MAVAFVIALPCVDVKDRACVTVCPVDCIYEGGRMLYIHPEECIDCGACEPACPVEAIFYEDDLPAGWAPFTAENDRFFADPLPGRPAVLGSPGGAAGTCALDVDTPFIAALPQHGDDPRHRDAPR